MLKAKRITATSDELFQKVMDLYELSFPAVEKRDRKDNERLLGDERFRLLALLDDEIFVGMAGVWDAGGMLYIEHLCTSPELRGKGYGAAALELFKATGKTVVLEIEPPEDELTKRRQNFYLRNGFGFNPYVHHHPPYRAGDERHLLNVMSFPPPTDIAVVTEIAEEGEPVVLPVGAVLYYPKPEETLWEVARRYRIAEEELRQRNPEGKSPVLVYRRLTSF